LDRPLSLAITRRLAKTSITPNQVTLATLLLGLLSAAFMAQPLWGAQVFGALLFLFTSIVDGCDGEIARLKFQQTRLGGWFDLWADNLVHMAVFGGIAAGLYRKTSEPYLLWLGALACLGVFLSAGWVSWKSLRKKGGEGDFFVSVIEGRTPSSGRRDLSWLTRLADYLTRRDFAYLVLILAVAARLQWFLWASAIGGNLFFLTLVLLWARLGSTRPGRPPA
jgi:phosphatidylglycerophosphate synthase